MNRIWEYMKARWRGEKREAPYGVRGRVYSKNGVVDQGGARLATSKGEAKLSARVIRADGTVEDLGVISTASIEGVKHG